MLLDKLIPCVMIAVGVFGRSSALSPMRQAQVPEVLSFVEGLHALKRMAKPEEIARSAVYLASNASSFTTGTALLADGGMSINRT